MKREKYKITHPLKKKKAYKLLFYIYRLIIKKIFQKKAYKPIYQNLD